MKKTLAALIVTAFAASAANAAVVYNNEGTKVDLNGSLRLIMEKSNKEGAGHTHSGLRNAGSRVALRVDHQLDDGYYALGRFELRFNGRNNNQIIEDQFGNVHVKRAYVGLGKKELGELTFGRQLTVADDLSTAEDYEYGIIGKDRYIPTEGSSVIRYDYKGIENLQLSASYQFANTRDDHNEVENGTVSNVFQVGAIYDGKWDDVNGIIVKFGYGRTNNKTAPSSTHQDGFLASLGYNHNDLIVSVDGGYVKENRDNDKKSFFVSPGFQVPVTEKSKIYGNYKYEQTKSDSTVEDKTRIRGFLLGADYKLHKQVVTFIEGKYLVKKEYINGSYVRNSKVKDKAIGVGMRVYF